MSDQWLRAVALLMALAIVARGNRLRSIPMGKALRYGLIWAAIIAVVALLAAHFRR